MHDRERGLIRTVADGLLSVVLAPTCAACRSPLESPTTAVVCSGCWSRVQPLVPPFCVVCGNPLQSWRARANECCQRCRTTRTPITRGRAIGEYDGALRAIIHALKYDRRRSIAPTLSVMMRDQGQSVLAGADFVVPVPLHWRKRWRRGFNQAEDLAVCLGLPIRNALLRVRATRTQTDLPAEERQANVRRAFRVRRGAAIQGARVVLVDDVSTTGATLSACARTLLDAGACEVRSLTAARVVNERLPGRRP